MFSSTQSTHAIPASDPATPAADATDDKSDHAVIAACTCTVCGGTSRTLVLKLQSHFGNKLSLPTTMDESWKELWEDKSKNAEFIANLGQAKGCRILCSEKARNSMRAYLEKENGLCSTIDGVPLDKRKEAYHTSSLTVLWKVSA